jgi:hypothetical protein
MHNLLLACDILSNLRSRLYQGAEERCPPHFEELNELRTSASVNETALFSTLFNDPGFIDRRTV